MTITEQIQANLQLKEGAEVEYKSAKGGFPQSFWETFSAFANTNGGVIVLGVKEKEGKFTLDGLTEEKIAAYKKQFWDSAHNKSHISIPLLVESDVNEIVTEDYCHLLVFNVPRAPYNLRPVYLTANPFGHTYKRRHEGDYVCGEDEVRQMFSDANNLKSSADSRILRGYTMDDIDLQTLRQFRQVYGSKHENHPWNNDDDMQFLEHIGAYRKDRASSTDGFTVAGLLMFGKTNSIADPECCPYFFPDYREHLNNGSDIRWTNRVYPDGTWEANLYQFFTRILPKIQQALPLPFSLDENQVRIDTTSAHTSLREALANTLIHCSYTTLGNITVDRFADRIVMSNPGTMLVSQEEYQEGGHSVCRNPLLQKMFVFIGIGEKGGSGADIIAKGWRDNGWKELPVLREYTDSDRVEMTLTIPNEPLEQNLSGNLSGKNSLSGNLSGKNDLSGKQSVKDNSTDIVAYLSAHPHSSNTQIAEAIGKSKETVKKYLQKLVEAGIIQAEGGNKNRTYCVK